MMNSECHAREDADVHFAKFRIPGSSEAGTGTLAGRKRTAAQPTEPVLCRAKSR